MAEMWTRSPIMQGNTEQHQLTLISQLCGSITPEVRARGWDAVEGGRRAAKRVVWAGSGTGHSWTSSLPCVLAAARSWHWSVPAQRW